MTAKKSTGCGDSKRGSFCTDHHVGPHHGGRPIDGGGGSHPAAKGHLHGGHPLPHAGHSEPDADERGGRSDHDADDAAY